MSPSHPFLIIGQGLAGTAVAWTLWERGLPFHIVDAGEPVTSSKIAAGLITPITGKKFNLSWRFAELYHVAVSFYRRVEKRLGGLYYHEGSQVRLLRDERERLLWSKRLRQPDILPWLDSQAPGPLVDEKLFHAERGGFQQLSSGWLDVAAYLAASREFFVQRGCYQEAKVQEDDLQPADECVIWQGGHFHAAILCRGWQQQQSRFFPWLQFNSARGVIATLKCSLEEERVVSAGPWIQPRGEGIWRAGSTYEFEFNTPLEHSMADLRWKLTELLRVPFQMLDAQAAIRPIIKHHPLVVLGRHPRHERMALFNGLGSKGALRAPGFAHMLVDHLLHGTALDDEIDVQRNG